jgi:hypothetical protein
VEVKKGHRVKRCNREMDEQGKTENESKRKQIYLGGKRERIVNDLS